MVIGPENLDELVAEPLFTASLCAAVPAGHPFAARASVRWHELRGATLLILDDDTSSHAAIDRALAMYDVAGATGQRLAQAPAVSQMVEDGLGIGVMPMHACAAAGSRVRPVALAPDVARTVMLVRAPQPRAAAGCGVWAHFVASSADLRKSAPQAVGSLIVRLALSFLQVHRSSRGFSHPTVPARRADPSSKVRFSPRRAHPQQRAIRFLALAKSAASGHAQVGRRRLL